jgi:hypothetical protein
VSLRQTIGLAVALRIRTARLTPREVDRTAQSVAALGPRRCGQIADANVATQFDCDDFVRRGSAGSLWRQQPVHLLRRMAPGAPKASQALISPASLIPAAAPRRSARAGDYWGPLVGSSQPSRSAVTAPQPSPQAVRGESQEGLLPEPNLTTPILARPEDPRCVLVRHRRRDVGGRGCQYQLQFPSRDASETAFATAPICAHQRAPH